MTLSEISIIAIVFKRRRRVVPYYFPRFGGSGSYNRFLKRFAYFDDQDSDKKRKRSTDNQGELYS